MLRWVHGSPKSGVFTKCTICGNIREGCSFSIFAMQLIRHPMPRNLQKRRDIREKAWQTMGRGETISKVSFPMSLIENYSDVTYLELSRRQSWPSQWMLLSFNSHDVIFGSDKRYRLHRSLLFFSPSQAPRLLCRLECIDIAVLRNGFNTRRKDHIKCEKKELGPGPGAEGVFRGSLYS